MMQQLDLRVCMQMFLCGRWGHIWTHKHLVHCIYLLKSINKALHIILCSLILFKLNFCLSFAMSFVQTHFLNA